MISPRRFAIACIAAVALWQGGWSVAAMVAHDALYDHRLINIRNLSGTTAENFTPAAVHFLRANARPEKPLFVFAGSSVTFGYSFSSEAIFSRHAARSLPGDVVLNLSVIGASTPEIAGPLICTLDLSGVEVDAMVLEIAVVNDASKALRGTAATNECTVRDSVSLFFTEPLGLKWLWKLPDEYAANFDPRPVQLPPLPTDYIADAKLYEKVAARLSRTRRDLIAQLKDRVGRLMVFPSPVYVDGLVQLGFKRANIERQINDALADCQAVPGITCLDTRIFSSAPEMFINVTHLGLNGHARFADWLLGQESLQAEAGADRRIRENRIEIGLRQRR